MDYHYFIPDILYHIISIDSEMDETEDFDSIIAQLSYNQGYFYLRHRELKQQEYSQHITLLVYSKSHVKTIEDLTNIYAKQVNKTDMIEFIYFQLQSQFRLPASMTLQELKMAVRKENIDGLNLFAYQDNRDIQDQANSTKYVYGELQYNQNAIDVSFTLPNLDYRIYIPVEGGKADLKEIRKQLRTQILRVFAVSIDVEDIRLSIVDPLTNEARKAREPDLQRIINDKTVIAVSFTNNQVLKEPLYQNNHFIVIKDTSNPSFISKTFHYDKIKDQKVIDVLRQTQARDKWEEYGLKIGDIVKKPYEIFSEKIEDLFKNSTKHTKHIAALIVQEDHIFELQTAKLAKKQLIDPKKVTEKKESHDQILFFESQISERQKEYNLPLDNGKKIKMRAIYLFTTQLQVKSSSNKHTKLYSALNEFMWNLNFCQVTPDQYERWEYNYISHLYHDLKALQDYQGQEPLWRGISKELPYKQGQVLFFKQFTSFSKIKQKALSFGKKTLFKLVVSQSGKQISEFSHLQDQKQVLFLSYSRFKVIGFDKADADSSNVILLEEIPRVKMPSIKLMILFWIEGNPEIPKQYWQTFQNVDKSIVMIQLLDNAQFQKYLTSNQQIVEDRSIEMTLISNMSRKENGIREEKAGVKSAQIFRQYRPEDKILFFIGNKNLARQKLAQKGLVQNENLIITQEQYELFGFLYEVAGLN